MSVFFCCCSADFGFGPREVEDGVDRLFAGFFHERAGVDHEQVGLFGRVHDDVVAVDQLSQHNLGVDPVLGAPERDKIELLRRSEGHGALGVGASPGGASPFVRSWIVAPLGGLNWKPSGLSLA
jgi:hypothetical protein